MYSPLHTLSESCVFPALRCRNNVDLGTQQKKTDENQEILLEQS